MADPAFVGRDAGEVAGVGACGVTVVGGAAEAFAAGLDVALVLTGSSVADVEQVIEAACARGVDVISTCEDLAYADLSTPQLARRIDTRAREAGITVVGTGVNPGFVMDRLPLTLAAACVRVDHVHVTRIVDAAKRRAPLRAKAGAGLTVEEFRAGVAARLARPPRLRRIVRARRPGPRPARSTTSGPPSTRWSPTARASPPARVAGLRQSAVGAARRPRDRPPRSRDVRSPPPEPRDAVVIDGDPAPRRRDPRRHPRRSRHGGDGAVGNPRGGRRASRAEDDPRSRPGRLNQASTA